MAAPILTLQDIHLTLGNTALLDGAELFVEPGERLCIVGRNGSGKSTLLKIAMGLVEPDGGRRFAQPGATMQYLPQEPDLSGHASTLEYVQSNLAPGDDESRAYYLLGHLGLSGQEATDELSGGQARRAALARVLAPKPDILLLDEPTNHLDLPAILWLEEELAALKGALVLISHDRRFLQNLSRSTLWLDRGRTARLDRGFAAYEAWRDQLLAEEESERHKHDRKIAAEEHWVRYGVTARRKRNVRRMAELQEMRRSRRDARKAMGDVKITVTEATGAGSKVIEAKKISKAYGDKTIVKDFSIRVVKGDRIGMVGANGSGKTTLINMLIGRSKPDSGELKLGTNIALATLDQSRALLDSETTLANVLTGGGDMVEVGGQRKHVIGYMRDFLFLPEQAKTPVRVLSGGERARLLLAKALATPSNLLVLDEPTNDLDLETLDLLEETIADYPGTVLLVSHDRDFLDRTVTATLFAEGDGNFTEYAGGYADMMAQRGEGVTAKMSKTETKAASKERKAAERSGKKLTFADKHALETLPKKIETLERTIATLQKDLSDGGLYARDPQKFRALSEKLSAAEQERADAEERWLQLEMLRESLEG